jgi:hypothetical protein
MATLYLTALAALAPVVDNGVLPGDPRVAYRLDEAQRRLINQFNFVSHREESLETPLVWQAGGTDPGQADSALILDDLDSTKLLVLCAYREENNALADAEALEKKAFGYVERDVVNAVERQRYNAFSALALTDQNTFGGLTGRLGLETFESYKAPKNRLQSYINQGYQQAIDHYNFVIRNEQSDLSPMSYTALVNDGDAFPQILPAEVVRGFVLAMLAQNADSETQYASGKEIQNFKAEAQQLIERNVTAAIQRLRFETRKNLADNYAPNTFGYHWGRIGLDMPEGLGFSDNQIKRAVNSAEEQLMQSGKWVGTVDVYTLGITSSGEVFLPVQIETVLFADFDGQPKPVWDRFNEWLRGGAGQRTANNPWQWGLVDRGEAVDPADGVVKRKYFVSYPNDNTVAPTVTVLAKNRFVPHTSDSSTMYLRNYPAIMEAALSLLSGGKVGSFETAKQFLSTQVNQQTFKQAPFGGALRRIPQFR